MSDSKNTTVLLATFLKWNLGGQIGYKTKTDSLGRAFISMIWCKICSAHADKIRGSGFLRGNATKEFDRMICGTEYVTKHNLTRHLGSKTHQSGVAFEKLAHGVASDSSGGTSSKPGNASDGQSNSDRLQGVQQLIATGIQPRIDKSLHSQAGDAYRKLIKTAYLLATHGQPLSCFKTLVRVQKANGVQLISGMDTSDKAREFIHFIANAIREKISIILSSCASFTILVDGSQARKTGSEKELVMTRVLNRTGTPSYFCIALQDIDGFGDATASNLKDSIDAIFRGEKCKIPIPQDTFQKCLIAATADGASVNTGVYNGLLTRLKNDDRGWLLSIHCVVHRVELAIKDSLSKPFADIKDFMVTLYYLFKRSGKFKRHFHETAAALGVTAYNFPKVHGTRFVSHLRRGLDHLTNNWIILCQAIENSIANTKSERNVTMKLKGILKKLRKVSFLARCCLYRNVLEICSLLSLNFERETLFPFEVHPLVEKANSKLQDLLDESVTEELGLNCGITLAFTENQGTEISSSLPKPGHMKRKQDNREYIKVCYNVEQADNECIKEEITKIKSAVIPSVIKCLTERFSSFEDDIYRKMLWVDPANWIDTAAEVADIKSQAERFSETLNHSKFDGSKIEREWKDLKHMVKYYMNGVKAAGLWERIFQYRRKEFPNISLVAELILSIGVSNAVVECGFSHLTSMLSDRRLSLSHQTMEDLLVIKTNDSLWLPDEREQIIQSALTKYMSTRRKKTMDADASALSFLPHSSKRKLEDTDNDEASEQNNCETVGVHDASDDDDDGDFLYEHFIASQNNPNENECNLFQADNDTGTDEDF